MVNGKKIPNRDYFFQVFSAVHTREFHKMLEMISKRRITVAPDEEKVKVDSSIFNQLSLVSKYSLDVRVSKRQLGILKKKSKNSRSYKKRNFKLFSLEYLRE